MSEISDQNNESASSAHDSCIAEFSQPASGTNMPIHIGPDCPRVTERVGPNQAETQLTTGQVRLHWLTPFALVRRSEPYELWNSEFQKMEVHNKPLHLRPVVKELASLLGCGADFVYQLVDKLAEFPGGPHNANASDMLKSAQGGGEGTSRLGQAKDRALDDAIWDVRVTRGIKIGRKAMQEIRRALEHSPAFANESLPGTDTISKRWNTVEIQTALDNPYERDHLHRLCGEPDKILGLNSVLCVDCATMSNGKRKCALSMMKTGTWTRSRVSGVVSATVRVAASDRRTG